MFHRHARIYIGFDCEDDEGNVHTIYGGELREVEFDPVRFESKTEANTMWGDLEEWAEATAANIATSEAEGYCGEGTFKAVNVDWNYTNEREWSDIPADIRANIVVMLERIKENLDNIDYVEIELIPQLDRYLSKNDLTRDDIRDIIAEVGLEDIL